MKRAKVFAYAGVCLAACFGHLADAETLGVPSRFSTIQAAIDAAEESDVVLVEPGRYSENLTLRSGVDVIGRETARTLLEPDDPDVATVTIADATSVRFSNFTLIGSGTAVSVLRSVSVDITNVVFDGASDFGLASDGSGVEVVNNVFFGNAVAISRGETTDEIGNNIFAGNGSAIVTTAFGQTFENVRSNCFFANGDLPSDSEGEAGVGAVFGDPRFVAPEARDFHLREDSPCIDIGRGLDVIDATPADAGAYGGEFADAFPFPVAEPTLGVSGNESAGFQIDISWTANESYLVTNSTNPGGYRVYYARGALPDSAVDFNGDDATNGASPIDVGPVTQFTLEGLAPSVTPPLAPRLIDAQGGNEVVALEWEAVTDADAYRVWYGISSLEENQVDVPSGTSFVVEGLVNDMTYHFAVSAIARATYHVAVSVVDSTPDRNESVLSPTASIAVGDEAESPLSAPLSATPSVIEAFPPLADNDSCFIATAAFGSKHAADVEILRAFRDRFLLPHRAGRWLIERYYESSPPAARWLEAHAAWKPAVRLLLKPAVLVALVALEGGLVGLGLLAAAIIVLAFAITRRRARRSRHKTAAATGARTATEADMDQTLTGVVLVAAAFSLWLALAAPPALAQDASSTPSVGPFARFSSTSSPRWMYSITGGYTYPDLDDYDLFYGDDRVTSYAVSGGFRMRDWLEISGRIGLRQDEGLGRTAEGDVIPDAVELTVVPLHLFADFIWERSGKRLVPYAGLGLGGAWYRQAIEFQPDVDGRTDIGGLARTGVRWRFMSNGSRETAMRPGGVMFTRGFMLFEAEYFDADADGIELGGVTYHIGVRFEFEL